VARSWGGIAVSSVPISAVVRRASAFVQPRVAPTRQRASTALSAGWQRIKRLRGSER